MFVREFPFTLEENFQPRPVLCGQMFGVKDCEEKGKCRQKNCSGVKSLRTALNRVHTLAGQLLKNFLKKKRSCQSEPLAVKVTGPADFFSWSGKKTLIVHTEATRGNSKMLLAKLGR